MMSPPARRRATVAFTSAVWARRARSMKTVRCSRAKRPTTGQRSTSDFATKDSGREAADDRDVEPGDVVRQNEHRGVARETPVHLDPQPEHAQEQAVEIDRQPSGKAPAEPDREILQGQGGEKEQRLDEKPQPDRDPSHEGPIMPGRPRRAAPRRARAGDRRPGSRAASRSRSAAPRSPRSGTR